MTKGISVKSDSDKELIRKELMDMLRQMLDSSEQTIVPFATKNTGLKIPLSIFATKLGVLEALVKYMKEDKGFSFKEISLILKRDNKTLWNSYSKAQGKKPGKFTGLSYYIPVEKFTIKGLSCMESLIISLKDDYGVGFNRISELLGRKYHTIWTTYNRAKRKQDAI